MKKHLEKHTQDKFQPSRVTRELTAAILVKKNPQSLFTKIALVRSLVVRLGWDLISILSWWSAFVCDQNRPKKMSGKKNFFFEIFSFFEISRLSSATKWGKLYQNDQWTILVQNQQKKIFRKKKPTVKKTHIHFSRQTQRGAFGTIYRRG